MAKRFISTNLFSDEWFCELSKDGKLFFLYFITNCDHAGVLALNKKLCEFQTGIKSCQTVLEELAKTLVTLKEGLYFMPKFLIFQYPGFPKSNVMQQAGALKILFSHGVDEELLKTYLTLPQVLPKTYGNDNGIKKEENEKFKKFIEWFNSVRGTKFPGSDTTKGHFLARLKDGYNFTDFQKTLKNLMLAENHIEKNFKYLTPDFITRKDILEREINSTPPEPQKTRYTELGERDRLMMEE